MSLPSQALPSQARRASEWYSTGPHTHDAPASGRFKDHSLARRACIWLLPLVVYAMPSLVVAQEDTSQRILPLPERDLSGLPIQMELLQKLRSMMEQKSNVETGGVNRGKKSPDPKQQLEQLRNALKSLTDHLPPDFVPPDLSSIPKDQLEQTLKSPEVQQQLRKMLEQFAKDGVLPPPDQSLAPSGSSTDDAFPKPPSIPQRPGDDAPNKDASRDNGDNASAREQQPQQTVPSPSAANPPADGRVPKSSADALQDFLRKLAGQEPPTGVPSENPSTPLTTKPRRRKDPTIPGNPSDRTKRLPDVRNALPESQPNAERPEQLKERLPNQPGSQPMQESDRQPEPGLSSDQGAKSRQDSFKALDDILERMEKSQPGPQSESPPDVGNGLPEQLRILQDYLSGQKTLPPGLPVEPGRSGLSPQQQRMVPMPPRGLRPSGPTDGSSAPPINGNGNPAQDTSSGRNESSRNPVNGSLNLSPEEASEFLKLMEAQRKALNSQGTTIPPNAPPQVAQPRPPADRPPGSAAPDSDRVGGQESARDIKEALEQRGFGGALKKIFEQAKQESRQAKSGNTSTGTPNGSSGSSAAPDAGIEQSVIRMFDGLKDDFIEIAKDGKFRDRAPDRPTSSAPNKSPSDSSYSKIRKAASDLFSGVASAPKGSSSSQPAASATGLSPLASGFDVTPVAVLAGLLLLVTAGYFGLRYTQTRARSELAGGTHAGSIRANEIRSRADVVRAFHEFAMDSAKSVQSWWTHRAVEKSFATSTADEQRAAATLTDAYEQARYLPADQEFSADQLQQTRSALQQFAHATATNR